MPLSPVKISPGIGSFKSTTKPSYQAAQLSSVTSENLQKRLHHLNRIIQGKHANLSKKKEEASFTPLTWDYSSLKPQETVQLKIPPRFKIRFQPPPGWPTESSAAIQFHSLIPGEEPLQFFLPDSKDEWRLYFGRSSSQCQIVLDDPSLSVSRLHGCLEFFIDDNGIPCLFVHRVRANPILINGSRILPNQPQEILSGDVITFVHQELTYVIQVTGIPNMPTRPLRVSPKLPEKLKDAVIKYKNLDLDKTTQIESNGLSYFLSSHNTQSAYVLRDKPLRVQKRPIKLLPGDMIVTRGQLTRFGMPSLPHQHPRSEYYQISLKDLPKAVPLGPPGNFRKNLPETGARAEVWLARSGKKYKGTISYWKHKQTKDLMIVLRDENKRNIWVFGWYEILTIRRYGHRINKYINVGYPQYQDMWDNSSGINDDGRMRVLVDYSDPILVNFLESHFLNFYSQIKHKTNEPSYVAKRMMKIVGQNVQRDYSRQTKRTHQRLYSLGEFVHGKAACNEMAQLLWSAYAFVGIYSKMEKGFLPQGPATTSGRHGWNRIRDGRVGIVIADPTLDLFLHPGDKFYDFYHDDHTPFAQDERATFDENTQRFEEPKYDNFSDVLRYGGRPEEHWSWQQLEQF